MDRRRTCGASAHASTQTTRHAKLSPNSKSISDTELYTPPCLTTASLHAHDANMSEYWKSTANYWCKFCSSYVRDTANDRRSHEASGKHQNNIQRSLRTLHKDKEREERDKQRAKDEVARLNKVVGGKYASGGGNGGILGAKDVTVKTRPTAPPPSGISEKEQRKIHAEQLVAMGVKIPEALRKEIMGEDAAGWKTVSERVVDEPANRSLADIVKAEQDEESKEGVVLNRGVRKRKFGEEQEARDEEAPERGAKAWGSKVKRYPGQQGGDVGGDLEALLSGVKKKEVKTEDVQDSEKLKKEESNEEKPLDAIPDVDAHPLALKAEDDADAEAVAPIVFKKRKGKK